MRGAVFHHEVSSWHCSVLIELYYEGEYYNCRLWRMGMIHVRILFVEEKSGMDKLFIFIFISVN